MLTGKQAADIVVDASKRCAELYPDERPDVKVALKFLKYAAPYVPDNAWMSFQEDGFILDCGHFRCRYFYNEPFDCFVYIEKNGVTHIYDANRRNAEKVMAKLEALLNSAL